MLRTICVILFLTVGFQLHAEEKSSGKNLFEKRCGVCHPLPNPSQIPPEGWEKRLEIMAPLARLKKKQKEEILQYIQVHSKSQVIASSREEDHKLVEKKCTLCHSIDRVFVESLKGDKGEHIVKRMENYAGPEWISEAELKRIIGYLDGVEPKAPAKLDTGLSAEQIFETRCVGCHSLERVYEKLRTQVSNDYFSHVISRMQEKAPQWVTDDEARLIEKYLNSLIVR